MIDPQTGIDFPFYQHQLEEMFGVPDEGGQFASSYLARMDFSDFAGDLAHVLDFQGNPWGFRIYGNYVMEGPLRQALQLVVKGGLARQLKTFDGCFNIRQMKGGGSYSVHSWGLAVDFNASTNPFGRQLITDFSDDFVACFLQSGFEWGGLWRSFKDAMHFQLPWTKDWSKVQGGPQPFVRA